MLKIEKVTVEKVMKSDESEQEEKPNVRNDPKLAEVFRWVKVMVMLKVLKVTIKKVMKS
jgi:hypothetical protein